MFTENLGQKDRLLERILKSAIEIRSDSHSHYDRKSEHTSTLDRTFIVAPSSLLLSHQVQGAVAKTPVDCYLEEIPDHAPYAVTLSCIAKQDKRTQHSLPDVVKDPAYLSHA